jgi:hypothetical protein
VAKRSEAVEPEKDVTVELPASAATNDVAENDDDTPFDDAKTEQAINDIVEHESDDLLAAQDAAVAVATPRPKRGFWHGLGRFLSSAKTYWITLLLVMVAAGTITAIPKARYWVLNTAGVRASSSITAVDSKTQLPLKGVILTVGGHSAQADSDGKATVTNVRLGPQSLTISQVGFSDVHETVTIGWGSNPLGSFALKAVGVRYVILVRDYLSEKPIAGVEAVSDGAVAVSDKNGKIELTLASTDVATNPVTIAKSGYRSEAVTLGAVLSQATPVALVTGRKAVFVSRQNGVYNVLKSDIDGKNVQMLLAGTGSETSNISLAVSPDGQKAALVSTRDNSRDADGFLLSTLSLISIDDGARVTLAHAAQIQLIDWIGPRLVFEQVAPQSSATDTNRYTVISYDVGNATRAQLAAATRLNVVFSAQGFIYYAVAADAATPTVHPAFYKIGPDGAGKQTALDKEVWSGQRVNYNTFNVQTAADGWFAYDIAGAKSTAIATPTSFANRTYADSPTATTSLWIDTGTETRLMQYDSVAAKDAAVRSQAGLTYPLRWQATDAVIYRLVTATETADYALSLLGGTPHKIADVANTYGFTSGQ